MASIDGILKEKKEIEKYRLQIWWKHTFSYKAQTTMEKEHIVIIVWRMLNLQG